MSGPSRVNRTDEERAEDARQGLAKLICYHKMAPHTICSGGLVDLNCDIKPDLVSNFNFEILERNCLKLYKAEQCIAKETFSKLAGQISLSVDLLAHEKRGDQYLCLSAQFIDADWKLRKWVIKYCGVSNMNMDLPSEAILKSLKEYDIETKILSLTAAGTGDLADIVKENVQERSMLPMDGQLFHVHCSSDIISRMVKKGFEEIDEIIDKVKLLGGSKSPPLWNLTSSMLSDAFTKFSKKEREKVRKICEIADRIYEITEALFEFKRPTPNLFLPLLQEIRAYLVQESGSSDAFVSLVALKMLEILNKYFDDMCEVLSITALLDPRYKRNFIEFCLSDSCATTVSENLCEVYDGYVVQCDQKEYLLSDSSRESGEDDDEDGDEDEKRSRRHANKKLRNNRLENLNVVKEYFQSVQSEDDESQWSDLDLYLEEPVLPQMENFSVLHWWKENEFKYPQLSRMARDFLAIPLSVATGSDAYYTEPREADWTLLSLKPELMNALKCTRSWKFGYVKSNISSSEAQQNFFAAVMRS
ncbi:zinc finger BED domain-containing protein DAYSLEEPER isoform X2 [Spinacia oleracea]|uniref:Zinc finger BED domain-containing protein DAYSLEEPER isoform X2 n=1 Tax=Spinacia oleracea TaxID=3562 RepID=A0ABM3QGX7_SPIOL|nr:zinc finger BED domain-containing protein DAYSLEEPER-like isoform X2 [Spinacia oleracea]XP_056682604.1 zinc finger BED domain-containing protein DAYSLEEPER-like isoform X2 [Spinacia oleracea]